MTRPGISQHIRRSTFKLSSKFTSRRLSKEDSKTFRKQMQLLWRTTTDNCARSMIIIIMIELVIIVLQIKLMVQLVDRKCDHPSLVIDCVTVTFHSDAAYKPA
jgi:hypothetical protein